ncbi:MAG: hypothetical protein SGARI_000649 [Bacillariaceae sp.]
MSMWLSQSSLMQPEMPKWLEEICQRLTDNDPTFTHLELNHRRIDDREARMLANALNGNTMVTVVMLACWNLVDDGSFALASVLSTGMKSIRKIQLRGLRISREAVTFFQHLQDIEQLEELSLRHCRICAKSAALLHRLFREHANIKHVRFVDTQFSEGALSEVCQGLRWNESISELYFVNTNIDAESGATSLSSMLQDNKTLQELHLCENGLGDEGVKILAQGLSKNRTLEVLNVRSNGISQVGANALSAVIQKMDSLTTLSLAMNEVGDLGAAVLAESLLETNNTSLQDVNLSENEIGEKGASAVANMLLTNATLTDLDLSFNCIGSNGASSIAHALEHNDTLLRLSLKRNNICSVGASAFGSKLASMRGLKELVMLNNPIDKKGTTDLLDGLRKNVEITYLQIGDRGSLHVLKEICHWIRLNQAGRRIFHAIKDYNGR